MEFPRVIDPRVDNNEDQKTKFAIAMFQKESEINKIKALAMKLQQDRLRLLALDQENKQNEILLKQQYSETVESYEGKIKTLADEYEGKISHLASEIEQKTHEFEKNKNEFESLNEVVMLKEDEITNLHEKLQQKEQEVALQAELMRQKAEEVALQAEMMRKKEEEVALQAELMRQKEEEAAFQAEMVKRKEEEMAAQAELMRQKEEEVALQAELMRQKEEELATQAQILEQKVETIEKEVIEKKNKIQNVIEERKNALNSLKETINNNQRNSVDFDMVEPVDMDTEPEEPEALKDLLTIQRERANALSNIANAKNKNNQHKHAHAKTEAETESEVTHEEAHGDSKLDAIDDYIERQKKQLIGKRLTKDIIGENKEILVASGTVLDEAICAEVLKKKEESIMEMMMYSE